MKYVIAIIAISFTCMVNGNIETPKVPMVKCEENDTILTADGKMQKSPHIVFGNSASQGEIPWQAAIKITKPTGMFFCGGSLIDESWIVTAAHCTFTAKKFEIFLGTLKPYHSDTKIVSTVGITHHSFNASNLFNDIGLIKLPAPVNLSATIKVIPIAPSAFSDYLNTVIYVSGWGRTSNKGSKVSSQLKYTPVIPIKNAKCATYYGIRVIKQSTICTMGSNKQSPCSGDSGGPLAIWGDEPQLVGVVSFVASSGCEKNLPAGYVRVASFRNWINNVTHLKL